MWKWVVIFLLVSGAGHSVVGQERTDGDKVRAGLGMARLAISACKGWKAGPAYDNMMSVIRMSAGVKGEAFDEIAFFKQVELEGEAVMARAGKPVCEIALILARQRILERQ